MIIENLEDLNATLAAAKEAIKEQRTFLDEQDRITGQLEIEYKKVLYKLRDYKKYKPRIRDSEEAARKWKEKRERENASLEIKTDLKKTPLPERLKEMKSESRWKTFARNLGNVSAAALIIYIAGKEISGEDVNYRRIAPLAAIPVFSWIYSGSRKKTSVNGYKVIDS